MDSLDHTTTVKTSLGFNVGGMGQRGRVKDPDVDFFAIDFDSGSKFIPEFADTKQKANRVSIDSLVVMVHGGRYLSQVCPSVVRPRAIDVVNQGNWKTARHPKECESMGTIIFAINSNPDVTKIVYGAGLLTRDAKSYSCAGSDSPREDAGGFIVEKNFFESGLCDHEPIIR